jgi:hypothetical protein
MEYLWSRNRVWWNAATNGCYFQGCANCLGWIAKTNWPTRGTANRSYFHIKWEKRHWDKLLVPHVCLGGCVTLARLRDPLTPTPCWNDKPYSLRAQAAALRLRCGGAVFMERLLYSQTINRWCDWIYFHDIWDRGTAVELLASGQGVRCVTPNHRGGGAAAELCHRIQLPTAETSSDDLILTEPGNFN